MADPKSAERTVLKVLTGAQAGVEVYLEPAEYLIGTGSDDDIQFIDVTMKAGHIRVRLAPGKIEIKAGSGSFFTAAGLHPEDADWQEVQPLDVITIGTTRFAFGPPTAQWTTIADQGDIAAAPVRPKRRPPQNKFLELADRFRYLSVPVAFLTGALLIGGFVLASGGNRMLSSDARQEDDVAAIRTALDRFPFGRTIAVVQDVDGEVFVSGFVETPVERRALTGAIQDTGVSVNLRLGVLEVLRSEVDGLIKADKVEVAYALSPAGDLTLNGVILDSNAAEHFVNEVSQTVIGLHKVDSKIRTADDLLTEIRDLAHLSQIDDAVVFRLNGTIVEANGIISTNKIDAWVGFLQAYSRRLGDVIGLRSFVQLQRDSGAPASALPQMPLEIGALPSGRGAGIDLARLKSGDFDPRETFAGSKPASPAPGGASARPGTPRFTPGPIASAQLNNEFGTMKNAAAIDPAIFGAAAGRVPRKSDPVKAAPPSPSRASSAALDDISARAQSLVSRWLAGQLGGDGRSEDTGKESAIAAAIALLTHASPPGGGARSGDSEADSAIAKAIALLSRANLGGSAHGADAGKESAISSAIALLSRVNLGAGGARGEDAGKESAIAAAIALLGRADLGAGAGARNPDAGKDSAIAAALDLLARASLGGVGKPPSSSSLSEASKELFAHQYLPLFALSREPDAGGALCRPGSRLTVQDLPGALFWLDLMSTTNAVTLEDFSVEAQGRILEAALNPGLVAACLRRDPSMAGLLKGSVYLTEASRNPEFVRFVTKSLPAFSIDITGAGLWRPRFVELRDGTILHEGEAPDAASRIDTVGELGIAVRVAQGFSADVYSQDINWIGER